MEERKGLDSEGLDSEGLKQLAKSKFDKAYKLYGEGTYSKSFEEYSELLKELEDLESMELYEEVALKKAEAYYKCNSDKIDINTLFFYIRDLFKSKDGGISVEANKFYVRALCEKGQYADALNHLWEIKEEYAVRNSLGIALKLDEEERLKVYNRYWEELDNTDNDIEYKKMLCKVCYECIISYRGPRLHTRKLIDVKSEKDSRDVIGYRFLDRRSEYTGKNELEMDGIVGHEARSRDKESLAFIQDLVAKKLLGAYIVLGDKYANGRGCEQDYDKAIECYEKAAVGYTKAVAIKSIEELHKRILDEEKRK